MLQFRVRRILFVASPTACLNWCGVLNYMKKRLVVIGEYFPPRLGGGRRLFEIMKRLSTKYDIRFIVVPPSYVTFIRKIEFVTNKEKQIFCENMIGYNIGLPRLILKLWRKRFLLPYMLTMMHLFFKVMKKLIELKPSTIIIDAPSPYSGLLGAICGRILNKKLLIEYNDMQAFYAVEMLEGKVNTFLKNVLILIEDNIIKSAWKVTAISDFVRRYASRRQDRKDIIVIPNGVDLQVFDPRISGTETRSQLGIGNETKLCVYAGRIEKCVGAEIVLETAKLLQKRTDIEFMIVGEGDSRMINRLSRLGNVVLTGLVPMQSVPKYLAAADIVLVPFSNSIASHAISPLKIFEALAMGKPVIARSVSGVREVITDNYDGILISSGPKKWASEIINLIDNPVKALFLGENARKTARKYEWDRLARKFDDVINARA